MLTLPLIPQEDFPRTDLSRHNADILELMLSNRDFVALGHEQAEQLSWTYRVGHPTLLDIVPRILEDHDHQEMFDHGVRALEAASLAVLSEPPTDATFSVNTASANLRRTLSDTELLDFMHEAHESFIAECPNMSEAIVAGAHRINATLGHYALTGAATLRRFAIETAAA